MNFLLFYNNFMIKMPTSCSAYGCTNNNYKLECLKRNVSFHKFPLHDEKLLRAWMARMRRKDFIPSTTTKICSDHFEPACFEYQRNTNRRCLTRDAVPTIFSYSLYTASHQFSREAKKRLDTSYSIDQAQKHLDDSYSADRARHLDTSYSVDQAQKHLDDSYSMNHEQFEEEEESPSKKRCKFAYDDLFDEQEVYYIERVEDDDPGTSSGTSDEACQTDHSFGNLIDELVLKNTEIEALKARVNKFFVPEEMADHELRALSGLSKSNFFKFFNFLNLKQDLREEKLSLIKQFFIFLIKVKTGISVDVLAYMFQVSQSTISRSFNRVKKLVSIKLQTDSAVDELGITFCANYLTMAECPSEKVEDGLSIMVPGFADKKTKKKEETNLCFELVKSAIDNLESSESDDSPGDKYDTYSKSIASELREIKDKKLYQETKDAIQGILNDAHVRSTMLDKEKNLL